MKEGDRCNGKPMSLNYVNGYYCYSTKVQTITAAANYEITAFINRTFLRMSLTFFLLVCAFAFV